MRRGTEPELDGAIRDLRKEYHVNQDEEGILAGISCFAFDLDGTVYYDETWIDGARELFARLEATGRRYCFMTNNSSKGKSAYIEKLERMGLSIDPETQMISSGQATISYLKREFPGKRVFLFGNRVLKEEFEYAGIRLSEDDPDVIVTAFAQEFDYRDLSVLCDRLASDIPYIATHPDFVCPTKTFRCGFMPDIGALQAYIKAAVGRDPDVIIGKPYGEIVRFMTKTMGVRPEETAIVGDRLYTDVRAGVENGLTGIFVLSGEGRLEDIEKQSFRPTLVFDSVKEIMDRIS